VWLSASSTDRSLVDDDGDELQSGRDSKQASTRKKKKKKMMMMNYNRK
jgi:hypothetical protein